MDSTYEKELMAALPLTGNSPSKAEMGYHGKFGHTLGRKHHIYIMIRIDIFYIAFHRGTQTVAPTLPGFQVLDICIQYLDSQPHKHIFYRYNSYDG